MSASVRLTRRRLLAAALAAGAAATLAACSSSGGAATPPSKTKDGVTTVGVAALAGAPFTATTLSVKQVDRIRNEVPKSVLEKGKLVIGVGALPSTYPPLVLTGSDQKTITGSEPDLGRLVAAVLGLQPVITNATWENLFIGLDSGRSDVGFSNITDTEERKRKYDFASYRDDNLGFEVKKSSTWNFDGDYRNLAGLTVSVGSGTNQEKILLEWKAKLAAAGKKLTLKYFPDQNGVNLALASGKIDAYFGPNPGIQYHAAQVAKGPNPTRGAGTFSGAGESLQGLIAATTKKGNGLAKPIQDAINYLIANGQYAKWLAAYNLDNEAVAKSELNPPGLPLSNS
jgi:polar amino acid transport system substrate-binding protein